MKNKVAGGQRRARPNRLESSAAKVGQVSPPSGTLETSPGPVTTHWAPLLRSRIPNPALASLCLFTLLLLHLDQTSPAAAQPTFLLPPSVACLSVSAPFQEMFYCSFSSLYFLNI